MAAQAGLNPGHEGWNDLLSGRLDGQIASARGWVGAIAFILTAEAAVLAALGGRLNRRFTIGGLVLCTAAGMVYLMSLALAVLSTYMIVLYPSGDVDLGLLFPDWYFPALIVIAIVALTALTVWLSAAVRDASAS
ncbi:hypothetical protein [Streptosporangium roseum]|uniref:Uncharacterized protein n=1 Tax=Streptosporangium roseum (strain ATCC 12428 / DSM 43021 / JCM 3005 / KCTC 9067 / NCIMB 10171 / NRRL 2505 / NI 9100) TaxID=479432 RepID=D2BBJ5_STRRD|nr:hypothetical protein [Streptosporangium roseum]ACZ86064.1 hypothetical protein Sros_3117 [Streptosporangium roseum DSM 43021]